MIVNTREGRNQRSHGRTYRNGDCKHVIHQEGATRDQCRSVSQIVFRHDITTAAMRIGLDRLAIARPHNQQQQHNSCANWQAEAQSSQTSNQQHAQDFFTCVGDGRKSIGAEHCQRLHIREALVLGFRGANRLADHPSFETKVASAKRRSIIAIVWRGNEHIRARHAEVIRIVAYHAHISVSGESSPLRHHVLQVGSEFGFRLAGLTGSTGIWRLLGAIHRVHSG